MPRIGANGTVRITASQLKDEEKAKKVAEAVAAAKKDDKAKK